MQTVQGTYFLLFCVLCHCMVAACFEFGDDSAAAVVSGKLASLFAGVETRR